MLKNEVFSEQAVHSFQLKLLRNVISRSEQCRRLFEEKIGEDRDLLRREAKKELLPSIVYNIRREKRDQSELPNSLIGDLMTT